jgi:hypothetical protein
MEQNNSKILKVFYKNGTQEVLGQKTADFLRQEILPFLNYTYIHIN